ncbi:hypothetical protein QN416_26905, partial [Glaciimonas sp. Cout2]|uniref:hypothetical protein n=1 Tax=Glaciimonas sp. Cout2 TaxID=3048621 RepID=UPI002B23532C
GMSLATASATSGTDLTGTGIGQGVAIGRVLRMPEPLPEPTDTPRALTPEDEGARAAAAQRFVAVDLEGRAERAGGAAQE